MNEDGQNELLIRIDERVNELKEETKHIKDLVEKQNCKGNEQRIVTLEKSMERRAKFEVAFWPSILTAVGTVVAAFVFVTNYMKGNS